MIRRISHTSRAATYGVKPLFVRSVEVIMGNTTSAKLLQKTCGMLPPSLLQYLLYKAIESRDLTCIEYLVRYWPFEILSFDVDKFFGIDFDEIARFDDEAIYEVYSRRYHSLFCNSSHLQLQFGEEMIDAIASGVYDRVFESQPVDQASSGTKFIVDLSMVDLRDIDSEIPSYSLIMPLMNLCLGIHPSEVVGDYLNPPDGVTCTANGEKVLIKLAGEHNCNSLFSFLNTSPCALTSEYIRLPISGNNDTVKTNVLQALENMTSLCFILHHTKDCGAVLAKTLTCIKEKGSALDAITIQDCKCCKDLNMDINIPAVACRRIFLVTERFGLFNCAYHPCRDLQSLYIRSNLKFDSEISKVIEHNCKSLLELKISGVKVAKNSALLLQETFQKCHALVTLNIANVNDGTLASARLHEIFCSMQGLVSLECLSVFDPVNVFGEDLCALHNLLHQGLPKLKKCQLTFQRLVVSFTLLKDPKFESIQELLAILLSGKEPSPDCHTVAFKWEYNQRVHDWLSNLRCNVDFCLCVFRCCARTWAC